MEAFILEPHIRQNFNYLSQKKMLLLSKLASADENVTFIVSFMNSYKPHKLLEQFWQVKAKAAVLSWTSLMKIVENLKTRSFIKNRLNL